MNALKQKKLTQYINLRAYLTSNRQLLASLPNLDEYFTKFDFEIQNIQSIENLQSKGTKTIKEQKKTLKELFADTLLTDAKKLKAYATYKDNKLLIDFTTLTDTKVNKLTDQEMISYGKTLYKEIKNVLPELSQYMLDDNTLNSLANITDRFEAICPEVANAETNYKNISSNLDGAFQNADAVLSKMDTVIELVSTSAPEFYKDYKLTRKVDYRADSNDLVGHVADAETGAGLPNTTLTFTLNGSTDAPIVKTSAEKGGFQIKTINPGIYTVLITKIGYQTQTFTTTIIGDDQFSLEVKLVRA